MRLYSFHATGGGNAVFSACADAAAAHREALAICKDLARDVFKRITPGQDWCLTVVDDTGGTVFRFRICEDEV